MSVKTVITLFLGVLICIPLVYFIGQQYGKAINISTNIDANTLAVESAYEPCNPVCTGYTPLMLAAMRGDYDQAARLIADGVPLDMQSKDIDQSTESSNNFASDHNSKAQYLANTALHIAIYNTNFPANFPVAQLLINSGASVNIHNNRGDTPIHYSMQRVYRAPALDSSNLSEREELIINLIAHGADINAQNNQGYTMLHIAVFNGEAQWIERLANYYGSLVDFNQKAFLSSCEPLSAVKGAPKESQTKKDCEHNLTPLQLANNWTGVSSATHTSLINSKPKILDANERDIMGMTGFMLAVIWEGSKKLKNPYYDASKDVNDPHRNYTVDALIKNADLNATVNCIKNPCDKNLDLKNMVLHIALLHQIPDMIKKILDAAKKLGKPIDVNLKNTQGDAPIHYIVKINPYDKENAFTLDAQGKKIPASYVQMRNNALHYLIDHGAYINMQNNNGDTLLHLAVKAHAVELVRFMLEKYNVKGLKQNELIDLSIRNKEGLNQGNPLGKTALAIAYDLKHTDIIALLEKAMPQNQALLTRPT